jgi:hypothetical protein
MKVEIALVCVCRSLVTPRMFGKISNRERLKRFAGRFNALLTAKLDGIFASCDQPSLGLGLLTGGG